MADAPFVPFARVVKVHGTRGELSVAPLGEFSLDDMVGATVWVVPPPGGPRGGTVESVRPGPKGPLIKISGIDDRSSAESVRGCSLVARPGDLPEGWDAEPFDPEGFQIVDEVRGRIGVIRDVIITGANDVWVVEDGPYGQVLVPVIDDVVIEIDEDTETVTVRLLDGLIDGV